MKKNTLITTLAVSLAFVPFLVSAQTATTSVQVSVGTPTEAQVFTACSQTSIEIRDEAIGDARTKYNTQMAAALDARKEAEKKAVALDESEKKDAIRAAVEAYKESVTVAQDNLTVARKEAWASFEINTKGCKETGAKREAFIAGEQKVAPQAKSETRVMMQANQATLKQAQPTAAPMTATTVSVEQKGEAKVEMKAETKSFREVIKSQFDSLKAFFKIGASTEATTN